MNPPISIPKPRPRGEAPPPAPLTIPRSDMPPCAFEAECSLVAVNQEHSQLLSDIKQSLGQLCAGVEKTNKTLSKIFLGVLTVLVMGVLTALMWNDKLTAGQFVPLTLLVLSPWYGGHIGNTVASMLGREGRKTKLLVMVIVAGGVYALTLV